MLAERSGVRGSTVSRILDGSVEGPRLSTLRKLADALGELARRTEAG